MIANDLDLATGTHDRLTALESGLRMLDAVDPAKPADTSNAGSSPSGISSLQQQLLDVQERLASAAGHEQPASMALYLLGRSQTAAAGETAQDRALAGPKAIALYQTALTVDAANYLAANELGVLLTRYGQLDERSGS